MHTLGFGSGRTGSGLGRIGDVCGGVAEIQGLEPGSSPTSGTCFPCSGACGPLNVYKSPFMGPCGGPFLLVAVAGLAAPSLGLDSGVAAHSFMAGSAWNCMTCGLGIISGLSLLAAGTPGKSVAVLDDVLEHRAGLDEPIGFGDGRVPPAQPPGLSSVPADPCSCRSRRGHH